MTDPLPATPPRPGPPLRFATPRFNPSVRRFVATESGSAAALLAATVLALLWANSPWAESYTALWETAAGIRLGDMALELDLRHWVNDAGMALFFLVLGLEINRQLTTGELRDRRTVLVPVLGAAGGILVPVLIYLAINAGQDTARGWGIVMSTDTAFLLGLLALVGPRCPDQLRLFLLTLAVADDVGAIALLAIAYTERVDPVALLAAAGLVLVMAGLRWMGVWRTWPYVVTGIALWLAVLETGAHPTLAGVVIGLMIPYRPTEAHEVRRLRVYGRALMESPSAERARLAELAAAASVPTGERIERALHPWSAYVVVPVFGFANAGVTVSGELLRAASTSRVTIGIVVALIVGKTIGIMAGSTLALRTGLGTLPGMVRYSHLLGGSVLSGLGFTIALFITDLAFEDALLRDEAKVGILVASVLAALLGAAVLRWMGNRWPMCSPGAEDLPGELPPLPWRPPERIPDPAPAS